MLTTREAAEVLGITRRQVSNLIGKGKLKATRFGRDWQVDSESVEAYKGAYRKPGPRPGVKDELGDTLQHGEAEL